MVPYQPTPARHIFDLIDRTQPDEQDVLIDLGSGLGQVPLMVAACTGARSVGIEIEPAYVAHARKTANALHLQQATFLEGDARAADLSAGTLFYLYTPFTGTILRSVLDALHQQAASRPVRIGTFGPCTRVVSGEQWLSPIGTDDPRQLVIFRSHRPTPM
jgi:trans-aconitate methyltransferase